MNDDTLIKDIINNTEVIYLDNLNVKLVNLNILYSTKLKNIYILGEVTGEPNDTGILISATIITDDDEYNLQDNSDSLFATFPGIQSFSCSLTLDNALLKCKKLIIKIERKFIYARDRNRYN